MSTPSPPPPVGGAPVYWPGQQIGLPASGAGSVASIGERIGARAIDGVVWFVMVLPLLAIEAGIRAVVGLESSEEGDALTGIIAFTWLGLLAAYDPITTRLLGATPGKRALGLAVATESDREPPGLVAVGVRALVQLALWVFLLPGILDARAAAIDHNRRAWHDRVVGTLVLRSGRRHERPQVAMVASEPWRSLAGQAIAARQRFDRSTSSVARGPLAERLAQIRRRIDDCVVECQTVADRGAQLTALAEGVDVSAIRARADAARADADAHPGQRDREELARAVAGEAASAERIHGLVESVERTLRRLVAQLNDAVNQAVAVVFGTSSDVDFESLVAQLEALRAGFAEIEAEATAPLE
jgi:uncharacterized RDD family membrane protein YckC